MYLLGIRDVAGGGCVKITFYLRVVGTTTVFFTKSFDST